MKKKYFFMLTLFTALIIVSCEKDDTKNKYDTSNPDKLVKPGNSDNINSLAKGTSCTIKDPVSYYTVKLASDPLFRKFVYGIIDNHDSIFQGIKKTLGSKDVYDKLVSAYESLSPGDHKAVLQLLVSFNIDTAYYLDRIAASVADGVYFYEDNKCFFALDAKEQMQILSNVLSAKNNGKLTWGEFTVCGVAAVGNFVTGYGGVVGQVFNMLTGGTAYLAWSDVWSLTKQIVRNSVPWWSVFGTLIEFGACLWAAW